ncbi:S T kinase [Cryptosporidium sp. chipmunk genotype I]|uniref:S T kinase n=1 Tax=Cryptosporidium sp. chipmunk genotype I TaxID=1280935 RepID=UPI00351A3AE5|nr:S T kinase [Cryptosporidium sp. chipmunk genotype I]
MVLDWSLCSTSRSGNDSKKVHSKVNNLSNTSESSNSLNKRENSSRFNASSSLGQSTRTESKQKQPLLKKNTSSKETSRNFSEISLKQNSRVKPRGIGSLSSSGKAPELEEKYCCFCKKKILNKETDENSVEYHRNIFSLRQNVTLDDFHTISIIGQGGYSIVRLVFDIHTGHVYALKQAKKCQIMSSQAQNDNLENLIEIDINSSKKQVEEKQTLNTGLMLNTEISLMYNSDSPWINKLYYYWEDNHFYYMLMEYMPGGDLMRHLIDLHTFDEEMAKFYIAELLLALDYLNNVQGHIHRDIKPDNILLDVDGHIKLIDFGLSKQIIQSKQRPFVSNASVSSSFLKSDSTRIDPHEVLIHDQNFHAGTPDYMAPEIHRGDPYSLCVDLWSVGIILFEMLFGGPPLSDPGQNSLITRNKVMNWDKHFYLPSEHHKYSPEAMDFICSLVCEPSQRIKSAKEAMKHPFFKGIDFTKIRLQKPPIVPKVKHKLDYSNFDKFPDDLLISFYNSVKASTSVPISNIPEELNFNSCSTNKMHGEPFVSEFFPNSMVPGTPHKLGGSQTVIENVSVPAASSSKIPICTPKHSYLPLITHVSSPLSNPTTASSWKQINSSPIFQTPRKSSPLSNNISSPNISLNSHKLSQSHSFSQILGKLNSNFSNPISKSSCIPQPFNNLTPIDKISSNLPKSTLESFNSKTHASSSSLLNRNTGASNNHKFLTFKERKSSENAFNRQLQKSNTPLFPQRSTSSFITRNNQEIMNILKKKNII